MPNGSKTKSNSMKARRTRTTLTIDNDVMLRLRHRVAAPGESLGKTASRIILQAVTATDDDYVTTTDQLFPRPARPGPARPGAKTITMGLVNQLRDETY